MKLEITVEQLNALLQYLAAKPFVEVHQLIQMLTQLPKASEQNQEKDQ